MQIVILYKMTSPIITKVNILNYKKFRNFSIDLNPELSIIVGDNESGKTTLLEAISICLKLQINNHSIATEVTPYIFNDKSVSEYIEKIKKGFSAEPPYIEIEVFFKDGSVDSVLKGENNSLKSNVPGIKTIIRLDVEKYGDEYRSYVDEIKKQGTNIKCVPSEYYTIERKSFAGNNIRYFDNPVKLFTIANMENRFQNGVDRFITDILDDTLELTDRATMSFQYRSLKDKFFKNDAIKKLNEKIKEEDVSDKKIEISMDVSSKTNLDSSLTLYVDDIPLRYSGKGEQVSIKTKLALKSKANGSNLIMIEEPEVNQSFSSMNKLVSAITDICSSKQIIITTHSSYITNKCNIKNAIAINGDSVKSFFSLDKETFDYFEKLPNYDTLRSILSKKLILVEGPSDELVVQKAYSEYHKNRLPLQDGIDVLAVNSLAFKRFLEIIRNLDKEVCVITDNDGNLNSGRINKLNKYTNEKIKIYYPQNEVTNTLEPCFVECNDLGVLNSVFKKQFTTKNELVEYMIKNKTEWALSVFETKERLIFPEYIVNAVKE